MNIRKKQMVELVSEVGVTLIEASASDDMVAMAAWVSHDTDSEDRLKDRAKVKGLISFLYNNKHMSPFEHGHFTFKVDVPLFVAREFMRHRTASYNEVSGRYTEMKPRFYAGDAARVQEGKPGAYYFKKGSDDQTALYRQTKRKATKKAWETYQERLEAGIAKEQAREELPLSLMTQFYVTMNPRNLMQFLTLRNDKHALKEIRDVAVKMEEIFKKQMPLTHEAFITERSDREMMILNKKAYASQQLVAQRWARVERENKELRERNDALAKERDEAIWTRDEAVDRYNREFVTAKEAQKEEEKAKDYQKPPFDGPWNSVTDKVTVDYETEFANGGKVSNPVDINTIIAKGCDYVIPRAARVAESAAPVYNIYLDAKQDGLDAKDIAKRVLDAINRLEKRKRP